jgi:hypothetical protein
MKIPYGIMMTALRGVKQQISVEGQDVLASLGDGSWNFSGDSCVRMGVG